MNSNLAPTSDDLAAHARSRRARLISRLRVTGLNAALLTDPRDIAYFTATPLATPAAIPACLLVHTSGESLLARGEAQSRHCVDEEVIFQWHDGGTISTALMPRLIEAAMPHLGRLGDCRVGVQYESVSSQLLASWNCAAAVPIDADVLDLERCKDALDLARIKDAVSANLAALAAAAGMMEPGTTELEVFAAAARAAMICAGEKVVHDGDYRCGAPGGPCRNRPIARGELYIIDAWTQRAGYWSDLARVFPVGTPGKEQCSLIEHVRTIKRRALPLLRPGTSGGAIWAALDAGLRELPALASTGLIHHGGHGIGVRLHEAPDINPGVTDTLRLGDVLCIEPGAYTSNANIRIEDMYLITEDGFVCLSGGD